MGTESVPPWSGRPLCQRCWVRDSPVQFFLNRELSTLDVGFCVAAILHLLSAGRPFVNEYRAARRVGPLGVSSHRLSDTLPGATHVSVVLRTLGRTRWGRFLRDSTAAPLRR